MTSGVEKGLKTVGGHGVEPRCRGKGRRWRWRWGNPMQKDSPGRSGEAPGAGPRKEVERKGFEEGVTDDLRFPW